jgi:hypothetical protein
MSEGPKPEGRATQGPSGAQGVIARFGGIRPMASTLGLAVSTVQGWRERGAIPARHHARVLEAAADQGIEIDPADLAGAPRSALPAPSPGPPARPSGPKHEAEPAPEPRAGPEPQAGPEPRPRPEPAPRAGPGRAGPRAAGAWLGGAGLGALALAAGIGLAVVARELWMPWLGPEYGLAPAGELPGVERRLAELEAAQAGAAAAGAERLESLRQGLVDSGARLEALEARVDRLAATAPQGDATSAARLAELGARLEALGARVEDLARLRERVEALSALQDRVEALSDLEARVAALAEAQGRALADLEARVAALAEAQGEARAALTGQAALRLGVERLSEALRGSGPFAAELGLLQDLAASGAIEDGAALERLLAPIAPHAEAGIPTLAALQAGFPAVARAVRGAAPAGAEDGWLEGALRRLSDLVTVRRLGPEGRVLGADAGAVVARAQDHLEAGELAAALAELEALEGPAAEVARSWREGAAARLAAHKALTGLGRLLLERLDAGAG